MSQAAAQPEPRWGDAVALILLCGGGIAAWWGDFGGNLLWLAPAIGVAALTTVGLLGLRSAAILAVAWLPAAILAAGLPLGALAPAALGTTVASLRDGVEALPTIGTATPNVQVWALAAVLLLAGVATILAGMLWRRPRWDRTLAGFLLLLLPLAWAIAKQQTPDSAWPGAVVLVAVVLRAARGRLLPIVAATSIVGAIALLGAQVAAPRTGWQPFGHHAHGPQFHELSTRQTYGPLKGGRRTGAVMLDVTGSQPALWRMQVLETFDGRRWRVANEDTHLPEPAARLRWIRVKVHGLRNRLVASPGEIVHVRGAGNTVSELGDGRGFINRPPEDQVYRVGARYVRTTIARLAGIPRPTGRRYLSVTQVGLDPLPVHVPFPLAKLADRVPPQLQGTEWPQVFGLSSRLSTGVDTELGVVRRVEDYLRRSGRFHYTTDVGAPGPRPLFEFLFHTHAGYCQHFAGAAALLLRVAGIPSRVAVGFATGEPIADHTWAVRDEDAHAWIEVYFPTVGWVPFNPTPAAAQADVAPGIDILEATAAGPAGAGGTLPQLAAAATALILLLAAARLRGGRRNPRTQLADLLARLSPQRPGPRTTLRSLYPTLTEIGPATAELAFVAERDRFAPDQSTDPHPRRVVWRALVSDVGFPRALGLMVRALRPANRAPASRPHVPAAERSTPSS